jgi:2-methylaconitate cis-trans-isomerase PrpF
MRTSITLLDKVSFETEFIDYGGNCGNISSAVGPFAIDESLVTAVEPVTTVRIHLTNSGNILVAKVPVKNGKAMVEGDCVIDGCPGSGAKITLDWSGVVGGVTGNLLPTGNVKDIIIVGDTEYTVSIVDAGNPVVFIKATALNLKGTESPSEIETDKALMEKIEKIRGQAAVLCGMVGAADDAKTKSPYAPFFAIVSPPADYLSISGAEVKAEEVDIVSRLLFMLKMHKTYPVTGTVATGAAVRVEGSVAWEVLRTEAGARVSVNIGHPGGVIPVEAEAVNANGLIKITRLGVYRTARRIMDGYVYVRKSIFS